MKILKYSMVLLFVVTLWGCSKGNPDAPITIDPSTGRHPAGMAVPSNGGAHVSAYFANPGSCVGCHGIPADPKGGIVNVSCSTVSRSGMSCHGGVWPHGDGFDAPSLHGPKVINNGLATCKKCHGNDYRGMPNLGVSCLACHGTNAPHAIPWKGVAAGHKVFGGPGELNLPSCADCHWGRDMSPTAKPGHIIPPGIKPSCFKGPNGELTYVCHPAGSHAMPYIPPTAHGAAARLSLGSCAGCHSDGSLVPRFNKVQGSTNLAPYPVANPVTSGCENCHYETITGLAHPYGWLPGRGTTSPSVGGGKVANTTTHATFNFGAAGAYCLPCHALSVSTDLPGSNAPSCMTQTAQIGGTTYCHFTASPVANPTGCVSCHGTPPDGAAGASPNQAFRHTAHFSATNNLAGITCSACHAGFGAGKATHATNVTLADTAVDPKFNENNLTATYTPATQICTNVSCHGGQILYNTPVPPAPPFPLSQITWKGSVIFNQTTCTKCHLVLSQPSANVSPNTFIPTLAYIGPISGDPVSPVGTTLNLHRLHAAFMNSGAYSTNPSLLCKECHRLPVDGHFSKIMKGRRQLQSVEVDIAAGTIGGSGTQISSYTRRPNPAGQSSCVADGIKSDSSGGACHTINVTRSWYNN